ncbi:D-alanyl-lipoteichoic acid biosynthesis protein DltD [Streptococcus constellatus subsp. pharyngis]|uniref:Protein DltD n=2 Tax=Streptococcus constellatus subsp. pharyngis SK1060 = CCUG 46377 TaxID=1035184 RepID=U2XXV3_STRCV|nr:D-alanyl-lipoteichoic acid biosynthesis protein DltD [Streptococcus constellatus]AGU73615.1 putative D-alanine transfer protein DltD [Streptococcus constellatus subsp. pharyngis C232]AGU75369.1 putative D-alanine transfer protein DltD [Streptococcus constellatus subsp. pharyngis C818]AGU80759.1 putative D-alanine transfer protein DltD [Streptococcus constellatus subsp. pharyngis C1050]QRP81508.1 D-alanyl-lipoteichoic acid biosynthesis protein DltD [Streptococcus constellatus]GAD44811.1 D-al
MLKRLWLILGPVICAFLMVVTLLFFYPTKQRHDYQSEKRSAVTLTAGSFKGRTQKVRALTDKKHRFVPYFGSSEWLRFDSMHPAVLSEKYKRNYRPYFLGQRGAASLTQYFGMQQMLPQIENKTAVYVISPQWFTKKGYSPAAFQQYFNSDQLTSFLHQQEGDIAAQYAAKRLLQLYPTVAMKDNVKKVADNQKLSNFDKQYIRLISRLNNREYALFSSLFSEHNENYEKLVQPQVNRLPDKFSYSDLEKFATRDAQRNTTNNDLGIDNKFYKHRLRKRIKKLKGTQKRFSYTKSPEYNDLQLVLNQFAKSKTNPIFVIPPVNAKWTAYTGLSQEKYQQAVKKIRYQLESQGFKNIADFSNDGGKPYFMQDTIHMGWLGWLAFDKAVNPFISNPKPAPNYQINNRFFSKEWANYDGDAKDFK